MMFPNQTRLPQGPEFIGPLPESPNPYSEPICRIVTPVGMLGYGFDEVATWDAVEDSKQRGFPTALVLDSGSTDSGPSKLALGETSCPRTSYYRDLAKLLHIVHAHKVPLIISSAGGAGTNQQVDMFVEIIKEISSQNKTCKFKTLVIYAEVEKDLLLNRMSAIQDNNDDLIPCGPSIPRLTKDDIARSPWIVAQMGPEPFLHTMNMEPNFDILIAGRAFDPSPYIAYACHKAQLHIDDFGSSWGQLGGFAHMGKIMECGGACATPKGQGAIATVYKNGTFDIEPLDNTSRCTPISVAAHALWYEQRRPDVTFGPGGWLDMNQATYEQLDDGKSVRVHGSLFYYSTTNGQNYQVKLEAAKVIGYRSIFMGSFKDPILIGQLDSVLPRVKAYTKEQHSHEEEEFKFDFHVYPKSRLRHDPRSLIPPPEVFVIGEVIAPTQELANDVASRGKIACMHGPYAGQKANAGNFAFGIGTSGCIALGRCPQWTIYHLLTLRPNQDRSIFRTGYLDIGEGQPFSGTGQDIPRRPVSNASESRAAQFPPNPAAASHYISPGTLGEIASVLRSKNAGPFEITFDVMFDSKTTYETVRDSGFLTRQSAADALNVSAGKVSWAGYFDAALAFKITVPRDTIGSLHHGGFMENDMHSSQYYLPLMYMKVPNTLMRKLKDENQGTVRFAE
ncbi:hypothetical protein GGR57DRAFT_154567 [Xylariaceae sp. FL1272]|nr:hypothetical protein GGR57DRAFT_154567 [Xylariaceae sp. FL1272]